LFGEAGMKKEDRSAVGNGSKKPKKMGNMGGMGGMVATPPVSSGSSGKPGLLPSKKSGPDMHKNKAGSGQSPDYTFRSQPSNKSKVKLAHNPELFNKVMRETKKVEKEKRSSILIDPDLLGRFILIGLLLLAYLIFFR